MATIEELQKLGVDIEFARRKLQRSDDELLMLAEDPLAFVRAIAKAVCGESAVADIILSTHKSLMQAQGVVFHTIAGTAVRPAQHDIDAEPDAVRDVIAWIKWWRTLTGEGLREARDVAYIRRTHKNFTDFVRDVRP